MNITANAHADDFGRPPAAFHLSDEGPVTPIGDADHSVPLVGPKTNDAKTTSARWSNSETKPLDASNEWKLRWRRPDVSSAADVKPLSASRAVVWNDSAGSKSRFADYPVRQAAQNGPIDPFDEPFPSKSSKSPSRAGTVDTVHDNPHAAQPPASPSEPMPADTAPTPMPGELPMPPAERDVAPAPPPSTVQPFADENTFRTDEKPCDRKYNGRNCCTDDEKCQLARTKVGNFKITSISLDITPSFTITSEEATAEIQRERALAEATSRTWKDRNGEVVAQGRFVDYRHGYVHIQRAGGETAKVPFSTLSDDDLCFVTAWWSLPSECPLAKEEFEDRNWVASTMTWKASALCHKPLYFEEVALERYGHTVGPIKQPFVSGAHFFGSFIALPYQMGINPPNECRYTLGYYRPGSCAPWLVPPFPVSVRGAVAQAGVILGGVYSIP